VSELRLTETGNAGPVSHLEREHMRVVELMKRERIKRLHERRGRSPEEKWADKRIES